MKHYYYDQKTRELVIFEIEGAEIRVLRPIEGNREFAKPEGRLPEETPPASAGRKTKAVIKKSTGYQKGTCGKCGELGHNAWHCPERRSAKKNKGGRKAGSVHKCSNCGQPGHTYQTCDKKPGGDDGPFAGHGTSDLATLIKEKRAMGMNSIEVAQSLKIKLSEVNKYW